ncbi:MAG: sigma-70 family RNA polymerase sigma factor [Planctomycetia bacterium]|nr:sigma-70 family RNA polymerase sigma factor [Planctomycetia bacterium]
MKETDAGSVERMTSCQGLVKAIAWKIHCKLPPNVDLDDLIGYGQVGLAEAARGFDETRGGQFTTYAYYRIRGAILDGLERMKWFNKIDFHSGKYEQMADSVLEPESQAAQAQAEHAGESFDAQVNWFSDTSSMLAIAYLMSDRGGRDDERNQEIEDATAVCPGAVIAKRELIERLHALIDGLPQNMATLIRASYFGGLTLTEAGKSIGVSKSRASRLHAEALEQLARSLRRAQLVD